MWRGAGRHDLCGDKPEVWFFTQMVAASHWHCESEKQTPCQEGLWCEFIFRCFDEKEASSWVEKGLNSFCDGLFDAVAFAWCFRHASSKRVTSRLFLEHRLIRINHSPTITTCTSLSWFVFVSRHKYFVSLLKRAPDYFKRKTQWLFTARHIK